MEVSTWSLTSLKPTTFLTPTLVRVSSTCHTPVTNHKSSPAQTLFSDIWPPFPKVAPKGASLSRNPSVERTFSLPSNPTTCSSFLLPSYPLTALPGGVLTPTLSRRHADSSLSMSNTWPNKRDNSPYQQDTSPRRDKTGTTKGKIWRKKSLGLKLSSVFVFFLLTLFFSFQEIISQADTLPDLSVPRFWVLLPLHLSAGLWAAWGKPCPSPQLSPQQSRSSPIIIKGSLTGAFIWSLMTASVWCKISKRRILWT